MRVGIQLPEVERRVGWPEYVAMARAAEASGFDSIWVAGGNSATVTRIDPRSNRVTATISLGSSRGVPNTAFSIACGAGSVWTTAGANTLVRIDPETTRIVQRISVPDVFSLAADDRFVWAGTWEHGSAIFRIDSHGARDTFARLDPGAGVGAMVVRGNALWVIVDRDIAPRAL
jgi:streptogramin lyase